MSNFKIGTKIQATAKSIHTGQTGTVVANYISMLLVEASDPKYELSHKNTIGEGKYFQIDARSCKEVK